MANIYDVAKRAGVSVATVSAVINNSSYVSPQLRQRVEIAVSELNYHPNLLARSLAKHKSHSIGMLIPDIANPFYPEIVRGAEDKAQQAGHTILLGNSDNRRDEVEIYLNLFLSKQVDGILLIKSPEEISSALLEKLQRRETPIVVHQWFMLFRWRTYESSRCGRTRKLHGGLLRTGSEVDWFRREDQRQ